MEELPLKKMIIVLTVLMLWGCGAKTLSWDDITDEYAEINAQAMSAYGSREEFLKNDYLGLLDAIEEDAGALTAGIKKDEDGTARKLFEDASIITALTSAFENESAAILRELSLSIQVLVKAAFDKADNFEDYRQEVLSQIETIRAWGDEEWSKVEKRKKISWSEVSEEFAALEEETIDNLVNARDVSEYELEQMKDLIADNYDRLLNGVNVANLETAKDIYKAAIELYQYTEKLESDSGVKVNALARMAREFVEECLGRKTEDPEYDFLNLVEASRRWSLSVWNEITTEIRLKYR